MSGSSPDRVIQGGVVSRKPTPKEDLTTAQKQEIAECISRYPRIKRAWLIFVEKPEPPGFEVGLELSGNVDPELGQIFENIVNETEGMVAPWALHGATYVNNLASIFGEEIRDRWLHLAECIFVRRAED